MDKVIVTKEDTMVGKIIDIDGERFNVLGKLHGGGMGGDWVLQSLTTKELTLTTQWVVESKPNLCH
jgi:hypothetical protein